MNYGNTNDVIKTCPQCNKSIDNHKIRIIRSTDKTEELARQLQKALSILEVDTLLRGLTLERTATMVGVAIVNYKSSSQTYLTVSGPGNILFKFLNKKPFGKKVIFIDKHTALISGTNKILNCRKGISFVPDTSKGTEYPVGSCAAQKLLVQIFEDSKGLDKINSIEMSEIMWRAPRSSPNTNREWSRTQVVHSCRTCKQVVPQMLCSIFEN